MATYERHLSSRRLRTSYPAVGNVGKESCPSQAGVRRASSRSTRKTRTVRSHHHHPSVPVNSESSKMERIDRSLKELAQLLGLQTVGVDEASLLETTVAFFKSFPETSTTTMTPDTERRRGRHSDLNPAMDSGRQSEQSSDASPTDAILAGFQDCMEETIRYLVDVEGFSPDDEVVVGLTAHLLQIRAKLDINNDATAVTPWSSGRSSNAESPTECEATTSTQTSPQETNTLSLALTTDNTRPLLGITSTSRTLPGGTLARGLPPAHLMTPLTVDTNQYYALPSPLNRTAMACAMKPSEPLLTVAQTRPTHTIPTYTSATVSAVSGHPLTATAVPQTAYPRRTASVAAATSQSYQSVLSANGCLIPCVPATATTQRAYGLNLNYVAPYVVAWVRPVQE